MKKRIISLLMAVCMVVLAVPVFVLPALAADGQPEKAIKFDLSNNWPTFDQSLPGAEKIKEYSWNNGWTIGRMVNGVYSPYTGGGTYWVATANYAWNDTGVYLKEGNIIVTGADYATATNKLAVGYSYTAQYTGKVTVDLAKIISEVEGEPDADSFRINPAADGYTEGAAVYMAVFLNGKMVWPTEDGSATKASDWKLVSTQADFEAIDLDVNRNDQILYAVASNGSCKSGVYFTPEITYAAGWTVVPETIEDTLHTTGLNWPIYSSLPGNRPLQQVDARWTLGTYNTTTHEFEDFTYSALSTGRTYGYSQTDVTKPWDTFGSIYLDSTANPVLKGGFHLGTSTEVFGAYQVKSMASATVKPYIKDIQLIDAQGEAAENATATVKVFCNGALLATINYTVAGGNVSADLGTYSVKKGDKITFIVSDVSDGVLAVAGSPVLDCTNVASFMKDAVAAGNSGIAIDDAELLVGNEFGLRLYAYATADIYEDLDVAVTLYVWSSNIPEADRIAANATKLEMAYTGDFSYSADFKGFSIRELTDDFYVQVVAMHGENEIAKSEIVARNMVTMLTEQYEDEKDPTQKQLVIDMLNYAAAAQSHFNYNTDKMANDALTAEEKKLPTADEFYAAFSGTNDGSGRLSHSEIGAFALILENKLSIRTYVDVSEYEKNCVITAKYGDSQAAMDYADAVELDDVDSFTISDIGLDEMDKTYYMKLVVAHLNEDGDEEYYFGYIITYSVESYAARMIDTTDPTLAQLIRAMMQLGDTIKLANG